MAEIEFLPPPRVSSEHADQQAGPGPASQGEGNNSPVAAPSPGPGPEPPRTAEIVFRPLTPDEIKRAAEPDFLATGNPLPDPSISTFIGAVSGTGEILAYLVLQVKLHAQPLVLRPGHQRLLGSLVRAAEAYILSTCGPTWVYLFTPAGKLTQLATSMGMQTEPWVVCSKLIAPEPPPRPAFEIVPERVTDPGPFPESEPYQARPDESAWEELFPGGVLPLDNSGRVQ